MKGGEQLEKQKGLLAFRLREQVRVKPESFITSSSLSKASLSFLLLSKASSHTCCHLVTSRLTRGFLVSMGACVADAYIVCVGERFPVKDKKPS